MLKTRILTALVLLPLALFGLFFTTLDQFKAVAILIALLAGWEWAGFMGVREPLKKSIYTLLVGGVALLTLAVPAEISLIMSIIWWVAALYCVATYPASGKLFEQPWAVGLVGLVVLHSTVTAMIVLRTLDMGTGWLLYGLCLVWVADTGAYFAGRRWGKHKLLPAVSPGKTIEGLGGAVVLTTVMAIGVVFALQLTLVQGTILVLVSEVVVLVSVLGDLTESLFKRRVGLKDSGKILPGHGGVMDRIDSITAALPFLAAAFHFNILSI